MLRFGLIIISFGLLGFAFYEMSGGDEFDAEALRLSRIDAPAPVNVKEIPASRVATVDTTSPEVTRVALDLTTLRDVVAPERSLQTTPARPAPEGEPFQVITDSAEAMQEPAIVLPSLIPGATPEGGVTVTPVDFGGGTDATLAQDIRAVAGSRVNVRGGPSTDFAVVNRLTRGTKVLVLEDPGNGWVMLRPVDGGPVGWMADFLLNES